MKNKLCMLLLIALLFSCDSGLMISEEDFRDVAAFDIPENDDSTGINVFTADFKIKECSADAAFEEYGDTSFVNISNAVEDKTQLTLNLSLVGLVSGDYSNVKVSASYSSLTDSAENLVDRIQFDRYGEMVFEVNTGLTSFDPSSASIVIDLNTVQKSQLGYITFHFEYANSVYNSSLSPTDYTMYLNIAGADLPPVAAFSNIIEDGEDNNIALSGSKHKGYTATLFNDLSKPASFMSQNLTLSMLNVVPEYPLEIKVLESSTVNGIELLQTESTDGNFSLKLNFAEESNKIKTTENKYVFEITDPNGYYSGLSEPLTITVNTVRTYPKDALADLKGSFSSNGDASPWSWRMHYRIREEGNKLVRKAAERNTGGNVVSDKYEW